MPIQDLILIEFWWVKTLKRVSENKSGTDGCE
jgi:hypothetical protein